MISSFFKLIKILIFVLVILLIGQIRMGKTTIAEKIYVHVNGIWKGQGEKIFKEKVEAGFFENEKVPNWIKKRAKEWNDHFLDKGDSAKEKDLGEDYSAVDREMLIQILERG